MKASIRPMQLDDLDSVDAIETVAHRAPWHRDILRDCVLINYDCRVLEVEEDSERRIVGYIICRYDAQVCHILNLSVAPLLQNQGYGRCLLQAIIDSQASQTNATILLEVRQSNLAALHLYQKMGFQQIGVKRGYYRDGSSIEDALVLQKYM